MPLPVLWPSKDKFSPAHIPGLQIWLDADAITGLSDGDPIATWLDQSGLGRDASQSTGAKKPTYKTGIINGKPVIRFDGTDDCMSVPDNDDFDGSPITLFAVWNFSAIGEGIISKGRDGFGAWVIRDTTIFGMHTDAGNFNSDPTQSQTNWTLSQNVIATVRGNNTVLESYEAGALKSTDSSISGVLGTSAYPFTIGTYIDFVNGYVTGDIAEIVFYNVFLSAVYVRKVERYLSTKWGIALS